MSALLFKLSRSIQWGVIEDLRPRKRHCPGQPQRTVKGSQQSSCFLLLLLLPFSCQCKIDPHGFLGEGSIEEGDYRDSFLSKTSWTIRWRIASVTDSEPFDPIWTSRTIKLHVSSDLAKVSIVSIHKPRKNINTLYERTWDFSEKFMNVEIIRESGNNLIVYMW